MAVDDQGDAFSVTTADAHLPDPALPAEAASADDEAHRRAAGRAIVRLANRLRAEGRTSFTAGEQVEWDWANAEYDRLSPSVPPADPPAIWQALPAGADVFVNGEPLGQTAEPTQVQGTIIGDAPLPLYGDVTVPAGGLISSGSHSDRIDFDWPVMAERLMPRLLARLRQMAPPEARAMAEAAAGTPLLDDLALYALADWLEERQRPEVADRVRRLAVRDGDLLVVEADRMLRLEERDGLRKSLQRVMAEKGRDAAVLVLDGGLKLSHFRTGGERDGR